MIYLSDLLPAQFTSDFQNLSAALKANYIPHRLFPGTKDVWMRDFMPVRTMSGRLISFRYEPHYLKGYEHLRTDFRKDIASGLDLAVEYSDINLDGGNVVFSPSGKRAVVSERIFKENPGAKKAALTQELEKLLEAEVIFIPALPPREDMTGHADGMVRFVDENTVIGNDVPVGGEFEEEIKAELQKHGIAVIDFPYHDPGDGSAVGCYLNYLDTGDMIFLPVFGIDTDVKAVKAAEAVFRRPVVPVMIPNIAKEGGCLNCISWEL